MIAYLDLPSGISGDMFLGCLIDAGWTIDRLRTIVRSLRLADDEWSVNVSSVVKASLRASFVTVRAAEGQRQRRLADVRQIIDASDLPQSVKTRAVAVFTRLAHAEARVHGTTPEAIHFHEVGAVDAIIDIVGVIAGLNELGIEKVYASAVPLGSGWAQTAHGRIPLPAPATLELLASARAAICPAPGPGEWVTPTGASLLAELASFEQPALSLEKVAIGAGSKECAWPNVARMLIGQPAGRGAMVQLETNIDDMNPQLFAAVYDRLFAAGAKDVWFTPIQMKKNRPAVMLSVLAAAADEEAFTDIILRETTTLGVRARILDHRHEARREMRVVDTVYGSVHVKLKWLGAQAVGASPEYDDCRALAEAKGIPVKQVYESAMQTAQLLLESLR